MHIIFIHIPKTGGSTFTNLLRLTFDPTNKKLSHFIQHIKYKDLDIDIRHLQFRHPKRLSMSGDIFNITNYNKYKNSQIYTIIRNPVDRLVSEFIFQKYILKKGPKLNKLKPVPNTFEEYINNPGTWNYQTSFLLGRGLVSESEITANDYNHIIHMIEKYGIYLGVTDEYEKFLNLFQTNLNINFNSNVEILKKSNKDFKSKINITQNIIDKIIKYNEWDYKLYKYAKTHVEIVENLNINWLCDDNFKF